MPLKLVLSGTLTPVRSDRTAALESGVFPTVKSTPESSITTAGAPDTLTLMPSLIVMAVAGWLLTVVVWLALIVCAETLTLADKIAIATGDK